MILTYWHLKREITKISDFINVQAIIRTPMNVRKHYYSGRTKPEYSLDAKKYSITFRNKNKIANIWEKGYKSYNFGKKVLSNPNLNRIVRGKNGKYIRLPIGKKGGKMRWRTLSEGGLRANPSAWIMPALSPVSAYREAYKVNKENVHKRIISAISKDIAVAIRKGL